MRHCLHQLLLSLLCLVCLSVVPVTSQAEEPTFREVFQDHGVVMLLIAPENGQIVDANNAAVTYYGYSLEDLRSLTIEDINALTPEQVKEERELAAQESRNYFFFRHRLASGEIRPVEVFSHPQEFNGRTLLVSIIVDMSLYRATREDLWHYQSQLEAMVDFQTAEIRAKSHLMITVLGGSTALLLVLVLLLFRDVRRRRKAEAAARRLAGRLDTAKKELERFAEIAAHHLQEPPRRIASYAALLTRRLGQDGEREDIAPLMAVIEEQAQRQRALVRDVQLYLSAGQELGPPAQVDVAAVIERLQKDLEPLLKSAGATVRLGELPAVPLDPRRFRDILRLLLENVVHHRDPKRAPEIDIRGERVAGRVVYRVADNGPGIPEEYRSRVFGMFEYLGRPLDPNRTGVGLAVVRHIMEASGGGVRAEETPGGGATIVLEFPRKAVGA